MAEEYIGLFQTFTMELLIDIVNDSINTPTQRTPALIRNMYPPFSTLLGTEVPILDLLISFIKIIQNFWFFKVCLPRYDVMILHLENILKYTNKTSHMQVIINKLYQSKSNKTKPTNLYYISDKNHNYSKYVKKSSYSNYEKKFCM